MFIQPLRILKAKLLCTSAVNRPNMPLIPLLIHDSMYHIRLFELSCQKNRAREKKMHICYLPITVNPFPMYTLFTVCFY